MKELFAGVDIHRDNYVGCIMDDKENVVIEKSFPSTKEGAQSFLCGMPVKAVAIEACGMWRAALKIFRELGYEVKLTSPKKTKDIAGKIMHLHLKYDRIPDQEKRQVAEACPVSPLPNDYK